MLWNGFQAFSAKGAPSALVAFNTFAECVGCKYANYWLLKELSSINFFLR